MPMTEVMQIWMISHTEVTLTNSIAGLRAKIYGTITAPMASFVACMPVFMGLLLAMALPA